MNFRTPSSVVILGGAGFIGYHLASHFSQNESTEVKIVDNFMRGELDYRFKKLSEKKNVLVLKKDLTDPRSYQNLFSINAEVYNCCALNGTQNFYDKPSDVIVNTAIPAILAPRFCAEAGVNKYFYFGSSESYAAGVTMGITKIPTSEGAPYIFPNTEEIRWSYGISKSIGDFAAEAARIQLSLPAYTFRIHNIYGPRMGDKHVIPDLAKKFKSGSGLVHGLQQTRSFMFIDDLIEVISQLRLSPRLPKVLNIGSAEEISILSLARQMLDIMKLDLPLVEGGEFAGSVNRRNPDISMLLSLTEIEWTSLDMGLKKYLLSEGFLS